MKAVNFGIDLGTTNSLIAKYENGRVVLFKNPVGHKESLASVVAFRKDRILIGDKAREYLLKDPVNVFGSFKRRMGTDDLFYVVNIDENVTPIELSTYILKELKQFIYSGENVDAVIITIPASFDTMQANATQKAGKQAGFQEVFLLQEPIAAGLAYFNGCKDEKSGYWLVYDLGGGTFDIALIEIRDGEMKVKDHEGNNFLGGVDFDNLLVEQLIIPPIAAETHIADFYEQLMVKHGKYEKLYYQLQYQAEEAKKELSRQPAVEIDFSTEIDGKTYDFLFTITVEQFNELIANKVQETIKMLQTILDRNHLQVQDINEIILVGGSTLIPYVRTQLKEKTGIPINTHTDPITAIATGAAFYAANKYYEPKNQEIASETITDLLDKIVDSDSGNPPVEKEYATKIDLGYNKMSKEEEEVLLVKVSGYCEHYSYRIIRSDGGFDTGLVPLRMKFTEFLPLLPNVANLFYLRVFNENKNEIPALAQQLTITHGQYSISGQPLPKDICIEIDDKENNTTKLEVVFEKNSVLPLKKTLYREISKTISKGAGDSIIINILEGDRFARSISNLSIGCIEISGKQLTSDLIKGSDIEIQLFMSDNRELTVKTYLVMTHQEFNNVFSISEKHINISRLKEQFAVLEMEIRNTLRQFNAEGNEIWTIQTENLLHELENHAKDLSKMKENDATDKRYVIAEVVSRISQEFDKVGGYERLESLQSEYLRSKELVEQSLPSADMEKENLSSRYRKMIDGESHILKSRNPAILKRATDLLNDLYGDILWNTHSHVVSRFYSFKNYPAEMYKNYNIAQSIFIKAEKAIEEERFWDLKRMINELYSLMKISWSSFGNRKIENFKGTGIS
ncbi:MAG: Hsp70 family protein [Candidatus Symbiothrix sp.]|jgi:molecular chaperone DnaK|nr:Hsp70 family protein [Candidatus Symbiothrix sp.]